MKMTYNLCHLPDLHNFWIKFVHKVVQAELNLKEEEEKKEEDEEA